MKPSPRCPPSAWHGRSCAPTSTSTTPSTGNSRRRARPQMPSEYAASLNRRFQAASRAFEERDRRRMLAEAAAARLETLATELEQLVASDQPLEEVIARWRGLRRDADVLREHASANPPAAERLERAIAALEEKELQQQQIRARQEQDNL